MADPAAARLIAAARRLAGEAGRLSFAAPVEVVYNPLDYAWEPHRRYLERFAGGAGGGRKRVVFVGMNPGPWGMAQTGVPFGEVRAVRDWMGISGRVAPPPRQHPRRPVQGFACPRSEASGRKLWGLMQARFGTAEAFFREHLVVNYCPLLFVEAGGANRVPEKLPAAEREPLFAACDRHLAEVIAVLEPEWLIGVGRFAEKRILAVRPPAGIRVGWILHPSPASPAAQHGWAENTEALLRSLGAWG